jgi:spermidine dehydrogenase
MEQSITRRDFLGTALLASGTALFAGMPPSELLAAQGNDFTGYGGVGEYSNANGNTWDVLQAGHAIRDRLYDPLPAGIIDTGEIYDCVIIGGGISGLAAAPFFQREAGPGMKSLILENHPIFGGEAKQNEFLVDGKELIAHQGSAIYQIQYPHSFLAQFYESIGLRVPKVTLPIHRDSRLVIKELMNGIHLPFSKRDQALRINCRESLQRFSVGSGKRSSRIEESGD